MAPVAEELTITHTQPATDRWADIVEGANTYGQVIVTGDDRSRVVVMSEHQYAKLTDNALAKLRAEWDRRLSVLQEPDTREKMRAFMDSTPEEFAAAANAAEQRRRKG